MEFGPQGDGSQGLSGEVGTGSTKNIRYSLS